MEGWFPFLEHEIARSDGERWINFLTKTDYKIFTGEILEIEQHGEMVHVRFAELTSYDKPDKNFYTIKKVKLIELIRKWHKLVKQNVDKIIIEEVDGKVKIYSE